MPGNSASASDQWWAHRFHAEGVDKAEFVRDRRKYASGRNDPSSSAVSTTDRGTAPEGYLGYIRLKLR